MFNNMKMNSGGNQLNPMSPQFPLSQPFMGQYNLNASMNTPMGLPIEHHPHHFNPHHHPTAHLHSQHQRFMNEFNFNMNKKRMKEENSDDDEDNDEEDEDDVKLNESVGCSNMNNLSGSKTPTSASRSRSTSPNNSKSFKRQRVHSNNNDSSPVKVPMMNHLSNPTASLFSHLQLPHPFAPNASNLPAHPLFAPLHLNPYTALESTNKQTPQPTSPYLSKQKHSSSTPSKQSTKKCDISNIESLIESKNGNAVAEEQPVDVKPIDPLVSMNQMDPSHFKDFLAAASAQQPNGNLPPHLLWYFYALSAQQQQIHQQNLQNEHKSIKKESEENKSERLVMKNEPEHHQDDEYEHDKTDESNEQQDEHHKSFEANDDNQINEEDHEDDLNESISCRRRRSSGSAKRSLDESELNEELDEQTALNQEELSNLSAVSPSKKIKLNSECATTD